MTCREREVSIIAHRDANPLRPDRRREAEENGSCGCDGDIFLMRILPRIVWNVYLIRVCHCVLSQLLPKGRNHEALSDQ
jgi:hypothetical protein